MKNKFSILFILFLIYLCKITLQKSYDSETNKHIHGYFPIEEYSSYQVRSIGVNVNFQETVQHLAFIIRTQNEKYYQLDLRLISSSNQWLLLLQQDDPSDRIKRKYYHPEDCYVFRFQSVNTMKDITDIAHQFNQECYSFKFFFKYIIDLRSISEWEEMLDFDHEKRLNRVNCMMFTEYFLKRIAPERTRRWIKEMVMEKGNKLFKELKY